MVQRCAAQEISACSNMPGKKMLNTHVKIFSVNLRTKMASCD